MAPEKFPASVLNKSPLRIHFYKAFVLPLGKLTPAILVIKFELIFFQGHEGEIMTLTPIRGPDFVSTSLDQTVNVWEGFEGKLRGTLPGPQVS